MNSTLQATSPVHAEFPPKGITNRRRWTIVGLLFTASLINYFDRATISFALPLISSELGLGPEAKGLLLSAFFWSYALMQIPIGWCADRLDLRWLYAGAFAVWSLAQGLTGVADSLAMLVLFRVILGIGESIYLPGGTKIVSVLFGPKERGLPSGLFDFGTRTGLVMEGLLIPWMLVHLGWRSTFVVVGFTGLLWLIPWLSALPKNLNQRARQVSQQEKAPGANRSASLGDFFAALLFSFLMFLAPLWIVLARLFPRDESKPLPAGPKGTFMSLFWQLRNRNLLGICLGFFCFDYYWYLLLTWLPDYLVEVRNLSILRAGLYAALPYLVFGVCEPIGGWIADRLILRGWDETRTRKGIVTIAFMMGLLLIPAAHVESAESALFLIMGASMVGLATGNLLVILQALAPPSEVGIWTGFENYAGNIGGVLAPLLTGILVARTGSFSAAFALGPAVLITGLLAYWFVVGKLEPPAEA